MFAPRSGRPLSTHALNAAKYTLYLLFIHREFPPCLFSEMDVCPPRASRRSATNARPCNTRHFVRLLIHSREIRYNNKRGYTATTKRAVSTPLEGLSILFVIFSCLLRRCGDEAVGTGSGDAIFVRRSRNVSSYLWAGES